MVSPEQQAEISKASVNGDDTAERVRMVYQDVGYFNVRVEAKVAPVPGNAANLQKTVIDVVAAGRQYRLGDLHFVGGHAFSESQLRSLFSIEPGDIFSRAVIEKGLDELRYLYGSQGYVNFTAFPDVRLNQDSASANLTIKIDEGKQFHLRDVRIVTINSVTEAKILNDIDQVPGQLFDSGAWDRLLGRIQAFLPDATPDMIKKNLDEDGNWVDVVLDFRRLSVCPSHF